MVIMETTTPVAAANPNQQEMKLSRYEQCREERIKANLERMQKLGIFDFSLKLKSVKTPTTTRRKNNCKAPQSLSSPPPSFPTRRSSRLQNVTSVSYSEVQLSKKGTFSENDDELIREGSKSEVYTEEHEKLLGDTHMSWTLFVDGYRKDGKRIYDPVRGKTCHQCRQKTLGHRTQCSKCNMVQGQFCGDCLYMRYGENILEANQNPNWICPVCRGICNCSLCRHAKGLAPTGTMYKKITNLGFKSVAHYLIQTQPDTDLEKKTSTKVHASAKRSLPFSDMGVISKEESPGSNYDLQGLVKYESEDHRTIEEIEGEKLKETQPSQEELHNNKVEPEKSGPELAKMHAVSSVDCEDCKGPSDLKSEDNKEDGELNPECEDKKADDEREYEREEGNKDGNSNIAVEIAAESKKKRPLSTEPIPVSVAGRLRRRREEHNASACKNLEQTLNSKQKVNANSSSTTTSPQVHSIAGRLRQRRQMHTRMTKF